ncbi:MAG: Phenol regulator MopR [Pseudomonas citronellolis]|nr:MAG: Phenol regulator MopR [Pseudomonas citronellolis]
MFGHERGAFTGALQRKIGRIESAHGGTLFLDEIGDMPHECQAVLLRFLQEGTIERLGGNDPINVDVRVISATHVDLDKAVEDGRFRSDLYHRLCVLRLVEPPLRERGGDIKLLANYALSMYRQDGARKLRGLSSDAIVAMSNYPWPGNVRELINVIEQAVVLAGDLQRQLSGLQRRAFSQHQRRLGAADIAGGGDFPRMAGRPAQVRPDKPVGLGHAQLRRRRKALHHPTRGGVGGQRQRGADQAGGQAVREWQGAPANKRFVHCCCYPAGRLRPGCY